MKITRRQLASLIKREIILESVDATEFLDSDGNHLKTGMVNFDWGTYTGRFAGELYYGSLGDIQIKGDPFTYNRSKEGSLKVTSGPESKINAIGTVVKSSTERLAQVSEENPCASATDGEILKSMHSLSIEQVWESSRKGKNIKKKIVSDRTRKFGRGALLGPIGEPPNVISIAATKVADVAQVFDTLPKENKLKIQNAVLEIIQQAIENMRSNESACMLRKGK